MDKVNPATPNAVHSNGASQAPDSKLGTHTSASLLGTPHSAKIAQRSAQQVVPSEEADAIVDRTVEVLIRLEQPTLTSQQHRRVIELIQQGIEPNRQNLFDQTPLHYASRNGHTEAAELLLKQPGIDVNILDCQGETPLHRAVLRGRTAIVKLLLAAPGIHINTTTQEDGMTPLHYAALQKNSAIMKLLLDQAGIDVKIKDNKGRTPERLAKTFGHTEAIRLLNAHTTRLSTSQAVKQP